MYACDPGGRGRGAVIILCYVMSQPERHEALSQNREGRGIRILPSVFNEAEFPPAPSHVVIFLKVLCCPSVRAGAMVPLSSVASAPLMTQASPVNMVDMAGTLVTVTRVVHSLGGRRWEPTKP